MNNLSSRSKDARLMKDKDVFENRKRSILALSQAEGFGYYTIRKLYSTHPKIEEVQFYGLNDLEALFKKASIKYPEKLAHSFFDNKQKLLEKVDIIINELFRKRRITFILECDSVFPGSLQQIPDKPYWLFVEGDINILNSGDKAAVVGTRFPTSKGIKIAENLTTLLIQNSFFIVSGLAEGIDEAAHRITNKLKGKGIAILGCGINLGFPSKTFRIREELVANGGAVVTEFMVNASYSKQNFVWRDRLQSGFSDVIFPIQGTLKGGTAHTIRFAEEQRKKIVGVFEKEIEDIPQNEIFTYLRKINSPIYDLTLDNHKMLLELKKSSKKVDLPDIEKPVLFGDEKKLKKDITKKKRNFILILSHLLKRINGH